MKTIKNAEADFFQLSNSVRVSFDVLDLPKDDQLALLRSLMHVTGTTAAILTCTETGLGLSKMIGEQWERYSKM